MRRSIPIECLAISGPSLVSKVRYVAATLLESKDPDDAALLRSSTYLFAFLTVLGAIEKVRLALSHAATHD